MKNLLCFHCGLVQQYPVPSFNESIQNNIEYYDVDEMMEHEETIRMQGEKRINRLRPMLQSLLSAPNMRAIDIGCGWGHLLGLCKDTFGAHVEGLEINEKQASYAEQKFGAVIHRMTIESWIKSSNEKFDLLILSHVLEHFLNPREILSTLRDRLTRQGRILIEVPNIGIPAKTLHNFFKPAHIWNFSPRTLCRLLEETEYGVLELVHEKESKFNVIASPISEEGRIIAQDLPTRPVILFLLLCFRRVKSFIRRGYDQVRTV